MPRLPGGSRRPAPRAGPVLRLRFGRRRTIFCSRPERAGPIQANDIGLYQHQRTGCPCGRSHDPEGEQRQERIRAGLNADRASVNQARADWRAAQSDPTPEPPTDRQRERKPEPEQSSRRQARAEPRASDDDDHHAVTRSAIVTARSSRITAAKDQAPTSACGGNRENRNHPPGDVIATCPTCRRRARRTAPSRCCGIAALRHSRA